MLDGPRRAISTRKLWGSGRISLADEEVRAALVDSDEEVELKARAAFGSEKVERDLPDTPETAAADEVTEAKRFSAEMGEVLHTRVTVWSAAVPFVLATRVEEDSARWTHDLALSMRKTPQENRYSFEPEPCVWLCAKDQYTMSQDPIALNPFPLLFYIDPLLPHSEKRKSRRAVLWLLP